MRQSKHFLWALLTLVIASGLVACQSSNESSTGAPVSPSLPSTSTASPEEDVPWSFGLASGGTASITVTDSPSAISAGEALVRAVEGESVEGTAVAVSVDKAVFDGHGLKNRVVWIVGARPVVIGAGHGGGSRYGALAIVVDARTGELLQTSSAWESERNSF